VAQSNTSASTARIIVRDAEAHDLRSVIATALAAVPIDEEPLRRGVWTFVRAARDAGAQPGDVIVALTTLVEAAPLPSVSSRDRLRQVILWCVEAYFGHLGGADVRSTMAPSAPRVASNR